MLPPDALNRLLPTCLHWHPDGEIRLVGHRIGLYHFIYYYNQGFTAEMILCQFPTLELAVIHKVIAFYLDHREEVDCYVAQYQAELDQPSRRRPACAERGRVEDSAGDAPEGDGARRRPSLIHGVAVSPRREFTRSTLGGVQRQRPTRPPARDRLRGRKDRTSSRHG